MRNHTKKLWSAVLSLVLLTAALPLPVRAAQSNGYTEKIATSTPNRDEALKNGKVFQLRINGDDVVGKTLTGKYEFYSLIHTPDTNRFSAGGTESGSTYRWLRGDSRMGTYTAIEGAEGKTYTLTEADAGQYIRFEVTPRTLHADGTVTVGETVQSEPVGPVLTQSEFEGIRNLFSKTASIEENDAAIAREVERKFGDTLYFVCDATAGDVTLHGSAYAYVRGLKKQMDGHTPTLDAEGNVLVSAQFLEEVLELPYAMDGAETVSLKTVAQSLGMDLWIGTADLAEGGNYRTTPLAKGLVILSDTPLDIDTNRDRDILNEAANSLYVLRSTEEQMEWFRAAKYGMFIHWDPSSITRVEISWDRQSRRPADINGGPNKFKGGIADPQYDSLYMDFNPTEWDPDTLMREAKENGIQYVVFTTKHHGAFANFQTEYRKDFSIANTPYKDGQGDLVGELAAAAHKYGIKLGFYYSPRDWSNPYYYTTEQYRYMDYYLGQLTELCSNYGGVDLLWFDSIGTKNGSAMGYSDATSAWDARTILRRIRQMQPDIIVNNRYVASLAQRNETPYDVMGDWDTPETKLATFNDSRPWESCMCPDATGKYWSDNANVTSYIPPEKALQYLINNTCNDGNLLLDFGPTMTGAMRPEVKEIFDGVGEWLEVYGESIFNTRGGPYKDTNSWGGSTYRINDDGTCTMYLHVTPLLLGCKKTTGSTLTIPAAPDGRTYDLESAYLLADQKPVSMVEQDGSYVITLPQGETWSDIDTVIVLEESLSAAAAAAIREAETLMAQADPILEAQTQHLQSLVQLVQQEQTAQNLQLLQAANQTYSLQMSLAVNFKALKDRLDSVKVGTNPWECDEDTYNRAILVCESAWKLLSSDTISNEAASLMNENLTTQLSKLADAAESGTVTFVPAGDTLSSGSTISMEAPVPYAQIRYTTDGTEPTAESTLYTAPLTPTDGSLCIKAQAFFGEEAISAAVEKRYVVGQPENLAVNMSAEASGYYQNNKTYGPDKAFDGNGTTSRWATDNGTTSAWIQVDLGAVQQVNGLSLQEYLLSGETTRIAAMDILCSEDGKAWTPVLTDVSGGADAAYSFDDTAARYIKLDLKACDSPTIYEIQVYHMSAATASADYLVLETETTGYTPGTPIRLGAYGLIQGQWIYSDRETVTYEVTGAAAAAGNVLTPAQDATGAITVTARYAGIVSRSVTLEPNGGEENIALGASAKGSTDYGANFSAEKAVDGLMTTRWASKGYGTEGSDFKTELELTNLKGNYFHTVVLYEYLEPNETDTRCDYIEVQCPDEDGQWTTVASHESAGYEKQISTGNEKFTKVDSYTYRGDQGTVLKYANSRWYIEGTDQVYCCTHRLTFPTAYGEKIRLLLTNDEISLFEVEVIGGMAQMEEIAPSSISLESSGTSVGVGGTAQICAQVHPLFTTNAALNYTSSNETVATVSDSGLVTGVKPGSAEITVSAQADPTVKAVFYVGVRDSETSAQPISVSAQGGSLTVKESEYPGLRVLVTARGDDGKTLSWVKLNDELLPVTAGAAAFTFVMPDGPVALTAGFGQEEPPVRTYTITVTQTAGGTISPDTVTVPEGESKTFTIRAGEGYVLQDVLVDGVSQGAISTVAFENVQSDHTIKALFRRIEKPKPETPATTPETPETNPERQTFIDIRINDWYYDAVSYVAEHGLMTGVSEGVFNPDGAVTRAMVWTVLARMEGVGTEGGSTWYAKAQRWAMENGVSDGTDPMGAITREQLAAMLYRFAGSPAVVGSLSGYPDAASVSDWAESALVWATEEGIINGMNGYLKPQSGATRAQLAAMLMRFVEVR